MSRKRNRFPSATVLELWGRMAADEFGLFDPDGPDSNRYRPALRALLRRGYAAALPFGAYRLKLKGLVEYRRLQELGVRAWQRTQA